MGSYYSALCADLSLAIFEERYICDLSNNPSLLFKRYLDDGLLILEISTNDLTSFLYKFGSIYPPNLKVTFNCNCLYNNFLDLTIRYNFPMGFLSFNTFFKPASLYTYVHPLSNHPKHIFRGIVTTELHRYSRTCSDLNYFRLICTRFFKRLYRIGYSKNTIHKGIPGFLTKKNKPPKNRNPRTTYCRTTHNQNCNQRCILKNLFRNTLTKHHVRVLLSYRVLPKTRNILLTKKQLHDKIIKNWI